MYMSYSVPLMMMPAIKNVYQAPARRHTTIVNRSAVADVTTAGESHPVMDATNNSVTIEDAGVEDDDPWASPPVVSNKRYVSYYSAPPPVRCGNNNNNILHDNKTIPRPIPFGTSPSCGILCANCGRSGHVYRSCNLPITSFGVICFRWTFDPASGNRVPQYLMVQRKDSLCFVEFIRGRYDPRDKKYIMHLLSNMTLVEREHIRTMTFPDLWHGFWQTDQNRGYMREYQQAFQKFSVLRRGHYVYPDEFITLITLVNATTSQHNEKEWGFPKGRRNINEKDIKCALREFREETGIDTRDVHVHTYVKPFEEVFTACNKVRYCHVYYIVQLKQDTDADITKSNTDIVLKGEKSQMREISRVSWLDEQTVKNKINVDHVERRDMFDRVHDLIMTSQFLQALKLPWIARSDVVTIPPHVARPPPPPPKTRLRDGVNRDDNDSDTQNINHQISDII